MKIVNQVKKLNTPFVFQSRKATVATIGASFITFIMTVLPVLFPEVAQEVWTETSNLLAQIVSLYLVSQGAVDLADKWNQPNQSLNGTAQLDIAPEKE